MTSLVGIAAAAPSPGRHREVVPARAAQIDTIVEGSGPPFDMLPSRGRDSEDYDEVAAGIARQGFRVLRQQPHGMLGSTGPLRGLTLHDYPGDVAAVIATQPQSIVACSDSLGTAAHGFVWRTAINVSAIKVVRNVASGSLIS